MSALSRRTLLGGIAALPTIGGAHDASAAPPMWNAGEPSANLLRLIQEARALEAAHHVAADEFDRLVREQQRPAPLPARPTRRETREWNEAMDAYRDRLHASGVHKLEAALNLSFCRWQCAEDKVLMYVPQTPADAKAKATFALEHLRDDDAERWVVLLLRSLAI